MHCLLNWMVAGDHSWWSSVLERGMLISRFFQEQNAWIFLVADPDVQIRGGGGGGWLKKFSGPSGLSLVQN